MSGKPAIFLDRDGTVNVEKSYLYRIADWEWTNGAPQAIKTLRDAGYSIIVVSNQSGIAQGMYGAEDVNKLHTYVNAELAKIGTTIDAFYFCPHHEKFGSDRDCACRKPKPGMLLQAAAEHGIDLTRSWMVGDKLIDVQAGQAAGVRTLLVRTGYGRTFEAEVPPQMVVDDLVAACHKVMQENKKSAT